MLCIAFVGHRGFAVCQRIALRTKAGESRLVVGVEAGVVTATAGTTATGEVTATVATTATTLTTATATATTGTVATATGAVATSTAAATAGSTGGRRALRLNPGLVDIQDVLSLALTLTLGLAAGSSNEVLAVDLVESLGVGPLLVGLAALVGLADLEALTKTELLLGLLGKVLVVRDALGLGLGRSLRSLGVLGGGLLELLLGDLLAGLLIILLGLALVGAPRLSSLLIGTAARTEC